MKAFSAPDFVPGIRGHELWASLSLCCLCCCCRPSLPSCTRWDEVWVPSSASRTRPFTALRLQASMNLISSGSRGQNSNSLASNILFTVHNCKFLNFRTCRTHLPFRPKYRTGQDTGDTVTYTALPKLLSQLLTSWRNLHFLPTQLWLTSLSTTVKMTG